MQMASELFWHVGDSGKYAFSTVAEKESVVTSTSMSQVRHRVRAGIGVELGGRPCAEDCLLSLRVGHETILSCTTIAHATPHAEAEGHRAMRQSIPYLGQCPCTGEAYEEQSLPRVERAVSGSLR